ncbi:hypothetical protein O6H91_01G044900 [Diphasiastrum complanatum]|uniref:Uncharacterized protein n=1 Tax=Diphasiastrum complanatum TaxID=34168 RepID=A0ACC2EQF7_DIPCM|nr:hypothetical protein O6H91_01G044900 [Diphasiastrum complanatum]
MDDLQMFRSAKDPEAMETMLVSLVSSYISDALLDSEHRQQHKEQCAERLKCQGDGEGPVHYAEQAILANLDWGMDAFEEAIRTTNEETRCARLGYAEKMLQVCALLDVSTTTANVPNSYLSAWAHLNLAFVWKLRDDDHTAAKHVMDMFEVDPFFSRVDFAPAIWERLFLPHLTSITTWYSEQREKILSPSEEPEEQADSYSRDDFCTGKKLLSKVNPDQAEQLQHLENLYQDSLDDHTRRYARYYRDRLTLESPKKWAANLSPIAEPPMTPRRELGDFQKLLEYGTSPQDSFDDPDQSPDQSPPIWEEDDGNDSAWKENSSPKNSEAPKGDIFSTSSYTFASSGLWGHDNQIGIFRRDNAAQETLQVLPPQRKRTKSYSPDSQEKEQQHSGEFCTVSESLDQMCRETNFVLQSLHESHLSTSSDIEETKADQMEEAESHAPTKKPNISDEKHILHSNISFGKFLKEDIQDNAEDEVMDMSFEHNASSSYLDDDDEKARVVTRPPKDFVCPITGHLFNDPVTLETGQTYEKKAIKEWLDRGNNTCPITRQPLNRSSLPKTNYVLKRLVVSWKETHPDIAEEFSSGFSGPQTPIYSIRRSKNHRDQGSVCSPQSSPCSTSSGTTTIYHLPNKHSIDLSPRSPAEEPEMGLINDLKQALSFLCESEDLQECEESVLNVKDIWFEAKGHLNLEKYLTKANVIDAFIEILSNSESTDVWSATIHILSELMKTNEFVKPSILKADPDLKCISGLLKRGFTTAVVLLHQLKPPMSQISKMDLIPDLVNVIKEEEENAVGEPPSSMRPKRAALDLMRQLISIDKSSNLGNNVQRLISSDPVLALVNSLDSNIPEERLDAVILLLSCMQDDGGCRSAIAHEADLALVLDILHSAIGTERMVAISFFSELVRLSRRTLNNLILQFVKSKGMLSSMHVLLAHLQLAPLEQRPLTAGLLLQLDLLEEHHRRSIYRDEAVEALIESLHCKESPAVQVEAAQTLFALVGHFSSSGKALTEALLLKTADLEEGNKEYSEAIQSEDWIYDEVIAVDMFKQIHVCVQEEEKVKKGWEKRLARALLGYEQGSILSALAFSMRSQISKLSRSSMISAVWLLRMLPQLPDTGLNTVAHLSLFNPFLAIFKSSQNIQEQVLAALALHSILQGPEANKQLASYAKDMCGPLRKLQKLTWVAKEMLEMIATNPSVNAADLWVHEDVGEIDLHKNGAIRTFARARGYIFTGHSDGTIKVWDGKNRLPSFVFEAKSHSKSITTLAVSQSTDKLYSGSIDRTIRVWLLGQEAIQCMHILEQKDAVNGLILNGSLLYVIPQTTGVQVLRENNTSAKPLNTGKHVQCIAYSDGKVYCGCIDNSIQEVDVQDGSSLTIQTGIRTLIGKSPIYALKVFRDRIYAAGAPMDGKAVKVWNQADKSLVGAIASSSADVWLRERPSRVASFNVGSKITCFLLNGDVLFCGSEDGKTSNVSPMIKTWLGHGISAMSNQSFAILFI